MTFRIVILLLVINFSSCQLRKKEKTFRNEHNLIGTWSIGSLQNNNEDLVLWVYANSLAFYESDTVWLPGYPGNTFSRYGKYKFYGQGEIVSKVEIITEDTVFSGSYDVTYKEYYSSPRVSDSLLSSVILKSDKTVIWLNSRLTGWRN